ncbi:hypothetical protein L1987_64443 [Smallanthus sonchifolius]|uniref:Uncharacterized protein n=1 Tax=Smallanthus sonchifolius TaxID=185202 RepID=A0ACB9CFZ8_9ASTR|nr:hypothetical protein L1987_64443 [Smallanthus sonchifolius]
MYQDNSSMIESPRKRSGLLRDQVQLVKKKDSSRYEIAPIQDPLSFEKGFFVVIRACQLLVQKNEGILLVGVAGPSGAGKTVFTDKVLNFMPSIAVITMDNYNDATRIVDGNFDDPRLTDYDTLLENIRGLKEGRPVQVPIYDFKSSSRIGYRTVEVPSSRIVYPMYKAFIEPDLQTAHIKIINKFNPFSGFQNPSYILKSKKTVTPEQLKAVLSPEHEERREETYDIYLLPPGEDPEACQSYLRMRNRDGKYNLMFEEWVTDSPFIISPRITFEVSVRLLGGLMALGYTIAAILKRSSHVFFDEKVCVKTDWLEQLNRTYVQVQGRDRLYVKYIAEQLGLDGTYVPRTYIEQIQLEKAVNDVMALPDDLKTKLSIDDDLVSSPKEALSRASADRRSKYLNRGGAHSFSTREKNLSKLTKLSINSKRFDGRTPDSPAAVVHQGVITHLSEQISTLNERMDDFTSRIEELTSKFSQSRVLSHQNMAGQAESCDGSATSLFVTGLGNGSLTGQVLPNSASSHQLARETPLVEEVLLIARGQRQLMHQLDNLSNLLRDYVTEKGKHDQADKTSRFTEIESFGVPVIAALAIGGLGFLLCRTLYSQK